jgi:hypothetical protein
MSNCGGGPGPVFPDHAAGPCGGTGRRARLKIVFRKECGFDSLHGHHFIVRQRSRLFTDGQFTSVSSGIYAVGVFAAIRNDLLVSRRFVGILVGIIRTTHERYQHA